MSYRGEILKLSEHTKMFLIGSHRKCDLIIDSLQHFEVCINLNTFTIFTHLDEEDASTDHGLWYRLKKGEEVEVEHGTLLMVDPYIFRVQS